MKKLRKKMSWLSLGFLLLVSLNFINADSCANICIGNLSENTNCIFETSDVKLSAEVTGANLSSVIFHYKINGTNYNLTAIKETETSYFKFIPKPNLIEGMDVSWKVYATDYSGNVYESTARNFHINKRTKLSVNPLNPDGANQWYITKPAFTLENPEAVKIFYKWNGNSPIECGNTCSFSLENTPNNGNLTGGNLKLIYWTNTACGSEKEQNRTFKIDLINPVIKNTYKPKQGEVFLNNFKPEIYAYIDEVYQGNSGIKLSSIILKLDGAAVTPIKIPVRGGSSSDSYDTEIRYIPANNLTFGNHTAYLYAEDNSGRIVEKNWSFTVKLWEELKLNVSSPAENGYTQKKVLFEILTNNPAKIEVIDYSEKISRWKVLCQNCNNYSNLVNINNDGHHNFKIRATDSFGNVKEKNISLTIDSEAPVIKKTFPEEKKFNNGLFGIIFIEENPEKLILTYGNIQKGYADKELNLENCSQKNKEETCQIEINLSGYDSQDLEYWFNLTDVSGRSKKSKSANTKVDFSKPLINNSEYNIKARKVKFFLEVFETNFYKINYIDYKERSPRFKILCSKLKNNICEKQISFAEGQHNVTIEVLDKAGNKEEIKNLIFDIV
jgi:hypothetical protein